jgi:hypothetical protein
MSLHISASAPHETLVLMPEPAIKLRGAAENDENVGALLFAEQDAVEPLFAPAQVHVHWLPDEDTAEAVPELHKLDAG